MIDIAEILTIAFVRICQAHLDGIQIRYEHKAWINIIVEYARNELYDVTGKILIPGFEKIEKNIKRDKMVNNQLNSIGWIVIRIWGNDIKKDVSACADRISHQLKLRKI